MKKLGIKIILLTIAFSILLGQLGYGGSIKLALTTFGIGSGIFLIFFDNVKFDD